MFLSSLKRTLLPGHATPAGNVLEVRVRGGYLPSELHAAAGEPVRITFLREESAPCSERVVFPDFGKSAMLPLGERVTVELPPAEPGRYEFTCAMNMLHGALIVEERAAS